MHSNVAIKLTEIASISWLLSELSTVHKNGAKKQRTEGQCYQLNRANRIEKPCMYDVLRIET